jgi:hypothetical protein
MRKVSSSVAISSTIDLELGVTGYEVVKSVANVLSQLITLDSNTANLQLWNDNTTANVIITNADVVITNADVVTTNADRVQTGLDRVATNADVVTTNADVVTTNSDAATTTANKNITNADVVITNADVVITNADVVTTNSDVVITNNDVVSTNADVISSANSASAASTSETNAGNSETAAANSESASGTSETTTQALYDDFEKRYLGVKSSDPTVDNNGGVLVLGAQYFSSALNVMQVYDGTNWRDLTSTAILGKFKYTATAGQTVFTGSDANGSTLFLTPGLEFVFLNGVNLEVTSDYTVTGSTLTLVDAAVVSDEILIYGFLISSITDAVLASVGGTFEGNLNVNADFSATGSITGSPDAVLEIKDSTGSVLKTINGITAV